MMNLAIWLKKNGFRADQVQTFYPSPMATATTMYHTNKNPLRKITRVNERISAELRAEFFNLFNHAQFNNPNGNVASSNFGRVTGAKPGRIGQLGLRIVF